MSGIPKFTVEQIAAALRESAGIRSGAALRLGCSPTTITNYVEANPDLSKTGLGGL